jgi:hypothetical protein
MGLMHFDKEIAIRYFGDRRLSREADEVARYWLSLWRGDQLPSRKDFRPQDIAPHLRALAIFTVIPDCSVFCRLQGSALVEALGQDITGQDWIALTKQEDRPTRLERWSTVARGAIGRGLRPGRRQSGEIQMSEEIMLPFGDIAHDGGRQVLFHVSWRQTAYDPTLTGVAHVNSLSLEFELMTLQA